MLAEELDPKIQKVVVVKLHIMASYNEDLLRSLHALASEVMENDWHFYILLNVRHWLMLWLAAGCRANALH